MFFYTASIQGSVVYWLKPTSLQYVWVLSLSNLCTSIHFCNSELYHDRYSTLPVWMRSKSCAQLEGGSGEFRHTHPSCKIQIFLNYIIKLLPKICLRPLLANSNNCRIPKEKFSGPAFFIPWCKLLQRG